MARKTKLSDEKPVSLLPALRAESKSLAQELSAKLARKQKVDALIADLEGKAPPTSGQKVIQRHRPLPASSPFFGLALPEAATRQLSQHTTAKTARELWDEMEGKYPTSAINPSNAVHWALRRRAERFGDVMMIGEGKWIMTALISEEEQKRINASLGPMSGRDRDHHIAKTKAGAANVKARGGKWGAPLKVNAEVIAKVNNALAAGKTVKEACELAEISVGSYYTKRALFERAQQEPGALN